MYQPGMDPEIIQPCSTNYEKQLQGVDTLHRVDTNLLDAITDFYESGNAGFLSHEENGVLLSIAGYLPFRIRQSVKERNQLIKFLDAASSDVNKSGSGN